jgi:hypothetical protein
MLDWLSNQWFKRPMAVIGGVFAILLAIDAIVAVWGERRPVGGFFEEFVARALHWGIGLGSVAVGVWVGTKVFERTKSNLLGWIVGILLFLVVGVAVGILLSKIPGIGWRMDRLMSDTD